MPDGESVGAERVDVGAVSSAGRLINIRQDAMRMADVRYRVTVGGVIVFGEQVASVVGAVTKPNAHV